MFEDTNIRKIDLHRMMHDANKEKIWTRRNLYMKKETANIKTKGNQIKSEIEYLLHNTKADR